MPKVDMLGLNDFVRLQDNGMLPLGASAMAPLKDSNTEDEMDKFCTDLFEAFFEWFLDSLNED